MVEIREPWNYARISRASPWRNVPPNILAPSVLRINVSPDNSTSRTCVRPIQFV